MKRIYTQDLEQLDFKVQMLTERVDKLSSSNIKSLENINERIAELEKTSGMNQRLMSSDWATRYLGISRTRLLKLAKCNEITFTRVKRNYFFEKRHLDEWISRQQNNDINHGNKNNGREL